MSYFRMEDEPALEHGLEEEAFNNNDNNMLALVRAGGAGRSGSGSSSNSVYVTVGMLEAFRMQLEEQFQCSFKTQRLHLKRVEDKCDIALAKIPVLDLRTEEVARLRRELEAEKSRRVNVERNYTECVDKLMEEIVQLGVKITELQKEQAEQIEKEKNKRELMMSSQQQKQRQEPPPPPPLQRRSMSSSSEGSQQSEKENDQRQSSRVFVPPPSRSTLSFTVEDLTVTSGRGGGGEREEAAETVIHQKAHRPGTKHPFACLCGKEFLSKSRLSEHIIGHQTMEEVLQDLMTKSAEPIPDRTAPPVASTSGSSNNVLQQRNEKVSRPRPKPTDAAVTTATNGEIHGKVPLRPRVCHCGQEFRTNRSCYVHIRYHTKARSFACKVCGKGFPYAYLLRRHLEREHKFPPGEVTNADILTGGWQVSNAESGTSRMTTAASGSGPGAGSSKQMYITRNDKESAAASHPGSATNKAKPRSGKGHGKHPTKQFYCLCGLKYRTNVNLYDHLRYFSGKNLLSCKCCDKQFVYASLLKLHMLQAHKVKLRMDSKNWKHVATPAKASGSGQTNAELIQIKMEAAETTEQELETAEPVEDERRYCLCDRASYGRMVGCDNEKCTLEWFHFDCVGLTYPPLGNWYCPPCHEEMKRK